MAPAPPVRIVTDTTGYLPQELVTEHGIELVSLYYSFDGAEWLKEDDVVDGDWGPFYERLTSSPGLPTTRPPEVEDFRAVYEPILATGAGIVSLHISSGLSETCAHARKAGEQLADEGLGAERILVVDAACTGGQQGLLALAAARAAEGGADAEAVADHVRRARLEARSWFTLDTLEFLKRGGRIGGGAAWLGSTLRIKPILTIQSEVHAVERVRTRERAVERLIEFGRELHAGGADGYCVQHARCEPEARHVVDRLSEVYERPPVFVGEMGPVLGTHGGPGFLGVAGLPSGFLE